MKLEIRLRAGRPVVSSRRSPPWCESSARPSCGCSRGWLAVGGGLQHRTIVAFVAFLGRLYGPASTLASVQVQVVSAFAVFERIFEYSTWEPEARRSPTRSSSRMCAARSPSTNVRFAYIPERAALDGVSCPRRAGQMAAFVGPSGAGKTTITPARAALLRPAVGRGPGRRSGRA